MDLLVLLCWHCQRCCLTIWFFFQITFWWWDKQASDTVLCWHGKIVSCLERIANKAEITLHILHITVSLNSLFSLLSLPSCCWLAMFWFRPWIKPSRWCCCPFFPSIPILLRNKSFYLLGKIEFCSLFCIWLQSVFILYDNILMN